MYWPEKIYRAPPDAGQVILGRTLPSLLDEACDRHPNAQALKHWTKTGWQSWSNQDFRAAAEALALGLLAVGLESGDRVGLFMHSDVNFCIADMSSLLAHLVNVPIYLGETPENIVFILQHSEAKALFVSNLNLLRQVTPCLSAAPSLTTVIVADVAGEKGEKEAWSDLNLPPSIQVLTLDDLRTRRQTQLSDTIRQQLRAEIAPQDLATIIYIAGATGQCHVFGGQNVQPVFRFVNTLKHRFQKVRLVNYVCESPKGVMLTHENLTANALAAFSSMPELERGNQEVVLSFLPLTHIFARVLLYGHINYGHTVAFTTPNRVVKHLRAIKPTLFATVPRLLEKVYQMILETGGQLQGFTKATFDWALKLAQQYELGQPPEGFYGLQLKLADEFVFSQWRSVFGGRLKYLLTGGAALKADLANVFSAAGISVLQGYGLTQTSSVVCFNRGEFNRAGTVGVPMAGVEIAIADDGEILVRAPYIMKGYYKNPEDTKQAIDQNGWFYTGDFGEVTSEGFLKITGYKKSLFKLSIGKYVTPERIEHQLQESPLVERALAVGAHRKFCALLMFPNCDQLRAQAQAIGLNLPIETLLQHPKIMALYQSLINASNQKLPHWSTVKRFQLINATLTIENGLLTPTGQINREQVETAFTAEINALYAEPERQIVPADQPQSLKPGVIGLQAEPIRLENRWNS